MTWWGSILKQRLICWICLVLCWKNVNSFRKKKIFNFFQFSSCFLIKIHVEYSTINWKRWEKKSKTRNRECLMVRWHAILRRHILECGCEISQQSETSVRRLIAVINLESRTPRGSSGDWGLNKGGTACQRPCKVFLRGLFIIFKLEDSPYFPLPSGKFRLSFIRIFKR